MFFASRSIIRHRRGVSEVMGALLLIVVVVVAVAALASFVSVAEANATSRQAYLTSVKNENLQITGAQFNPNPNPGLTSEWYTANLTVRNTNTAPSTLSYVKVGGAWLRTWEVSGQKFGNGSDIFFGSGRSGEFVLNTLTIPAKGVVQVNLNFTTVGTTKDLGLQRNSTLTIVLLTAAGNFFTTIYDPPTAAFTESVVQTPFLSASRDLLQFNGGQSTNGNGTVQSYQWTIEVPPQSWNGQWNSTAVETFTASGRIFTYPEDLLSQGCFATQKCTLDEAGPILVTLEVTDSNGFTSSTLPTIIAPDQALSPPGNLAVISNTVSGTCYNMEPGYCTASLTVQLTDVFGNDVSGQVVDFSTSSGNITNINPTFAATNSNGEVTTTVTFGLNGGVVQAASEVDSALKVLQEETGTLQLTVNPSSPTIDSGQSITLTGTATGGSGSYSKYDWYSGSTCTGTATYTGQAFTTPPLTTTTTYCVQVTDSRNGTASTTVTVTVSSGLTVQTPTPASQNVDQGQTATISDTAPTTGTAPYTYQWLEERPGASSYTNAVDCSAPSTLTCTFVTSGTTALGTYSFELKVTDSSVPPATATSVPAAVTVGSGLVANPITSTANAIDLGQSVTLTAHPTGGTPPYTDQWYATSSCAGSVVSSGPTYAVSPSSTTTFSYQVTDSGSTPQSLCSAGFTVTVNPALTAPVISSNYPAVDTGQSAMLSTTTPFTGGTSPYTCNWMEEAPGASVYTTFSSGSCSAGGTLTVSTGTLSTLGTWSIELQVNDNAGESLTSNAISVTVNAALTAPTVTASSSSIPPGTSTTLTTSALATDGTPSSGGTYTCQWLEEAPGATGFSAMGSSFSCAAGNTYGISTGPLATAGDWNFEFQVTDSGNPSEVATSAAATVTVT